MERLKFAILSGVLLLLAGLLAVGIGTVQAQGGVLTHHAPISINGNSQFTSANGVVSGSGTQSDPYIIESWVINASSANGIEIDSTTAYFIVRNCLIENGGNVYAGIFLYNTVNGTIENNTCENNVISICLDSSYDNLTGNTCENNDYGITLSGSNNTLTNNTCSNNDYGIYIGDKYNTLTSNTCESNYYGIYVSEKYNTLTSNTCENNDYGICLDNSFYDNLTGNTCENDNYGIYLTSSSSNIITLNYLLSNTENNAYDDNTNAWDNGSAGNYWSDWQPGMVVNGVALTSSNGATVDQQRTIAGRVNMDHYPLVLGYIPPEIIKTESPPVEIPSISPGAPQEVAVENTNITQLTITTNTTVENVGVTVQQLASIPASISIGAPGVAYQYFNVLVENLSDAQIENVAVDFQVAMSWITSNGIDMSTITLNRYDPTTASWTALPTTLLSEDNTYAYFSAVSPGLSVFEVLGQPTPTTTTTPTTTAPPTTTTTTTPTTTTAPSSEVWTWVAIGIVIIVVIAIVAWALMRKK